MAGRQVILATNSSPAFVYNQINGGADSGSGASAALNLLKAKGVDSLAVWPLRSVRLPNPAQRQPAPGGAPVHNECLGVLLAR